MKGMSKITGKALEGIDHIRQSIDDILTTPIGSRVMRRDYGSLIFELIDQAMNEWGKMRLIAATADAIRRWEPRVIIEQIFVAVSRDGKTEITVQGKTVDGLAFANITPIGATP